MAKVEIEGIRQEDLDLCISKLDPVVASLKAEKIDPWALRASLLKFLFENADEYFSRSGGTYREIAAFDNGVAKALEAFSKKESSP